MKYILKISLFLLLVSYVCIAEWQTKQPLTNLDQNAVCYSGTENAFILCDEGKVLYTHDSGINWNVRQLTESSNLNAICFVDNQISFIVGDKGKIFRSDNYWNEWTEISIQDYFHLNDVAFSDYEHGVIVGSKEVRIEGRKYLLPSIHTTINGGYSWMEVDFDYKGKLNSVAFFADGVIWAVGDEGKVFKSTDYGRNWAMEELGFSFNLNTIQICPDQTAVIAGDSGVFLYSYDFGDNWTLIPIPEYYKIKSACFNGFGQIITAGVKEVRIDGKRYNMATMLKISANNKVWKEEFSQNEGSYNSVSFCNSELAIAVGDNGALACFDALTFTTDEMNTLPNDFILNQNFPNPFNPSTTISWQSPVSGKQTIKVYDVLGNEVATLVNEYSNAGSYEVEFNASDLASGIYLYRIQVGSFVQTKKMILVK